jgi:aminoglycoside phosphotransferase (APT) family kinase protein
VEGQNIYKAMDGMPEAKQVELWKEFSQLLADIHKLDWESAGFGFLDPPKGRYGYVNRWLSTMGEWCEYISPYDASPILAWLEDNKPPSDHYALLHGDYHPDNVIARMGEVAAIVDWEGVSIGDAAYDVCWPPLLFRLFGLPEEWSDRAGRSFLRYYEEAAGRELRNIDFYQVLKASFFLLIGLILKTHGAQEIGVKKEAEILMRSGFDLPGRCARFIEEKTGITIKGL